MKPIYFWLLTIFLFSVIIAGFLHPVTAFTQDLGRHLLMGKIILTTHTVPTINLLSYTYPAFPFINHHYLSEVLFYVVTTAFGTNGLLLMMTSIVMLSYGTLFFYLQKRAHIIPISVVTLIYSRVLFERTDIRPELFGFLLLSLFLVLLYRYRESYSRTILLLVPLELVWVQLHISFIIGIAVIGLFFLDSICLHYKNLKNKQVGMLLLTLLLATLTTVCNPNGIAGALYPFHIFQNYGYAIEENQTIFFLESLFNKPTIPYFKLSVLLLFISLLTTLKKSKPIDWLLAGTFSVLAASAVRNFPLFVLATMIPATTALSHIFTSLQQLYPLTPRTKMYTQLAVVGLLICVALWQVKTITTVSGFGLGTTVGAQQAADFYVSHSLQGPVFNNFDIGSYLESRIYPTQRVFIDGRPEAYPISFFKRVYVPMQESPAVFSTIENQYHFKTIFFAHTDQTPWASTFLQSIITNSTWIPIYLDHSVIILVKDIPENAPLIHQLGMKKDKIVASHTPTYSKREPLQLLNFYLTIHDQSSALMTAKQVIQKDPSNCQVLSFILSSQTASSDLSLSPYMQQYATSCR